MRSFKTWYLFGGNDAVIPMSEYLLDKKKKVKVSLAERHSTPLIQSKLRDLGIECSSNEPVNECSKGVWKREQAIAIVYGSCQNYYCTEIVRDAFQYAVLELMPIPYPKYLGGAHWTHAILKNDGRWGTRLIKVTAGEKHSGPTVYSDDYLVPLTSPEALEQTVKTKTIEMFKWLVDNEALTEAWF